MADLTTITATVSTISDDTPENKIKVLNAKNNADALKDHVGEPFLVRDVIMSPGTRSARSGNPEQPCVNTYLITGEAALYSQSDGVARSMSDILAVFPDLNAPNGLVITCFEKSLPNGNTLKTLSVELP